VSKRIGTLLIEKGLLTPDQLDAALKSQLIVGGHLGTSLIELGFIDERPFGQALAEAFDAAYAPRELFDHIPRSVIETLPRELVEKHCVVPLKKVEKSLDVAMAQPNDFIAVQELAFATGLRIVPWVSPEVRLYQAMERYYQIKRPLRYVSLSRRLDEAGANGHTLPQTPAPSHSAGSSGAAEAGARSAAAIRPAAATASVAEMTAAAGAATASAPATAARASAGSGTTSRTDDAFSHLADLLCRVETLEEIASAVCSFIVRDEERCILFRVVDEKAVCWGFAGEGFRPERLEGLSFQMHDFTLFHQLAEEPYYCGPTLQDGESTAFFDRLGVSPPCEIALVPTYRSGRIDSLLYVDSGSSFSLLRPADDYRRLARQSALAIYVTSLKKRLRET